MCGFGGVVNHFEPLNHARIGQIASKVNFRGPDNCGICILDPLLNHTEAGNTAVFFNRLAIMDLDIRSNQPFEDENHLLAFNGEIYNYLELKAELQQEGIDFRTTSDTEVLFFAIKCWGKRAFGKLNGMFSFFWLDKKERKFIVCRDRLGIKPLYYHFNNGAFYFSSELHSIIRIIRKQPTISVEAVEMYLWMQFIPTPNTIFDNIYKLPPGTYIESSIDNLQMASSPTTYWDAYEFVRETDYITDKNLEEILKDSLQRQLHADVPLGLFLSSGVDSSLLAAMVNKHFSSTQTMNFFTVSFNESTFNDESHDASSFIKGFKNPNMQIHTLGIDASYLQQHLLDLYQYFDEPFGDYASILNWAISKKAKDYVTVAISGDGADELFWGYSRYNKWQDIGKLSSLPLATKTTLAAAKLLPRASRWRSTLEKLDADPVQRHFELFLMPGFRQILQKPITTHRLWALENIEPLIHRKDLPGILDLKTYLSDAMLYKVDRSSMATSLEVRVPYLDNTVLEYALKLKFDSKSNKHFRNKAILKELLQQLAPHYQSHKIKKGFSFPLKKWLKEHWKDQVMNSVTSEVLSDIGLDPQPYLSIVKDFYQTDRNYEVEVWYLLNLCLWKESFDRLVGETIQ